MRFPLKEHPISILVIIAILSCLSFIFSNRTVEWFKFWNEIMTFIYDIWVSTIAAWIFYYFQIFQPERRKRKFIKGNFMKYWLQTKMKIIEILLYNIHEVGLAEKLCDFKYFREYFSEPHDTEPNQTRWHWVLNHLSENSIDDIAIEFEWLMREIDFVLGKIEIHNNAIFQFLKRLQSTLYHHKKIRLEYWEEKMLSRLLWDILWSWSMMEWPRNYDFIEDMVNKI